MDEKITYQQFKTKCAEALKKGAKTFFVGDLEILVSYSNYLIQYIGGIKGMTEDTLLDFQEMKERRIL